MKLLKATAWITALFLLAACKKESNDNRPPKSGTREELTKDSIFLYAKETYLWNESLPSYKTFNPRLFTGFQQEVNAFSRYAPKDKYSFIDNGEVSDELGGTGGDYGFLVGYNKGDANDLRISYVYKGSPADQQSLKRGYQVIAINGRTALNGLVDADIDFISNAIWGSAATVDLQVKKPDNSVEEVSVTRATYAINPILYQNVYTAGGKRIGYFVLNSFVQISKANNEPTEFKAKLDNLLTYLQGQQLDKLIVDLRYNGGGSVETADYLANYLAPPGTSGVMHIDHYNKTMQANKATILKNQPFEYDGKWYSFYDYDFSPNGLIARENFSKKGTLNLSGIYFIVTKSTASASELLINSLKPVVSDIKLIGRRTYGKPVGFFPIHIDTYDLYIPQFQTKNRNGEGDYFDGLSVDKEDYDDISKEFGDKNELYLAYALNYAEKGNFNLGTIASVSAEKPSFKQMSAERAAKTAQEFNRTRFKGMVKR